MTPDWGGQAALCLLLLILPISALIARRVPILRVLLSLASWAAIGAVARGARTVRSLSAADRGGAEAGRSIRRRTGNAHPDER